MPYFCRKPWNSMFLDLNTICRYYFLCLLFLNSTHVYCLNLQQSSPLCNAQGRENPWVPHTALQLSDVYVSLYRPICLRFGLDTGNNSSYDHHHELPPAVRQRASSPLIYHQHFEDLWSRAQIPFASVFFPVCKARDLLPASVIFPSVSGEFLGAVTSLACHSWRTERKGWDGIGYKHNLTDGEKICRRRNVCEERET